MSMSPGAEFSAPILDALGRHDAANTLRWPGPVKEREDEPSAAELAQQLADAEADLAELVSSLCERCMRKWVNVTEARKAAP